MHHRQKVGMEERTFKEGRISGTKQPRHGTEALKRNNDLFFFTNEVYSVSARSKIECLLSLIFLLILYWCNEFRVYFPSIFNFHCHCHCQFPREQYFLFCVRKGSCVTSLLGLAHEVSLIQIFYRVHIKKKGIRFVVSIILLLNFMRKIS